MRLVPGRQVPVLFGAGGGDEAANFRYLEQVCPRKVSISTFEVRGLDLDLFACLQIWGPRHIRGTTMNTCPSLAGEARLSQWIG